MGSGVRVRMLLLTAPAGSQQARLRAACPVPGGGTLDPPGPRACRPGPTCGDQRKGSPWTCDTVTASGMCASCSGLCCGRKSQRPRRSSA
jgi:hypothetical protein